MLSRELQRYFITLGSRVQVRTSPKENATSLAIRSDARGEYFALQLPRLSRNSVTVLAIRPRDKRLLLRLTHGDDAKHLIVQAGHLSIREVSHLEAEALLVQPTKLDSAIMGIATLGDSFPTSGMRMAS